MKTCFLPSTHRALLAGSSGHPLRLQISGAKILQLLQADELHVEDLQCLDERSRGLLKQLLLRCCLTSAGSGDE